MTIFDLRGANVQKNEQGVSYMIASGICTRGWFDGGLKVVKVRGKGVWNFII